MYRFKYFRFLRITSVILLAALVSGCSFADLELLFDRTPSVTEAVTHIEVPFAPAKIALELERLPEKYGYTYDENGEMELFDMINEYRRENGLQALEMRDNLRASARYKSNAMLQLDYFEHSNPNFEGRGFDYLIWDVFGLKYTVIGENLASVGKSGPSEEIDAAELFEGWKSSPDHNAQMLNPDFRYTGIGLVRSTSSGPRFKGYRTLIGTQHFGY
ncbi:CAP domain-containing protein [Youngiibacter fragilis]|nr:CAP domain-containing protein [Youngiibacter fragilis]